ncbi:MAG TPA: hypothetical protein ENO14_04840, partial [Chromatiales bacterium]|nr:hypothetical protein [Chromatiales bacterium]
MTYRNSHRIFAAAVVLAAIVSVTLLGACDGGGSDRLPGIPAVKPPENMADVRNFTRAELDTLRSMKERNH